MRLRAISVLVSLIIPILCIAQQRYFTERYNLSFEQKENMTKEWLKGKKASSLVYKIDSSEACLPLCISQQVIWKTRERLRVDFPGEQKLVLPETNASKAVISIKCKSKYLKQACLVIAGIGKSENVLFADTVQILSNDRWKEFSHTVSMKGVTFIQLDIRAEGSDSTYEKGATKTSNSCEQKLWLDELRIEADGKDINSFPDNTADYFNPEKIRSQDVVPLSFDNSAFYDRIPELKSKRIVALGESVHGSKTLHEIEHDIMKHQIEKGECKLLLIEAPMEKFISVNRFIQGDESFLLDSIMSDFKYSLIPVNETRDLLVWLKNYNKTSKEKIWIAGMDQDLSDNPWYWLRTFLYSVNKKNQSEVVYSMLDTLFFAPTWKSISPLIKIAEIIQKNKSELLTVMSSTEIEQIEYYIESFLRRESANNTTSRDFEMFSTAQFLINKICAKEDRVIVRAHFSHANYVDGDHYDDPSFGHFMKAYYGDTYSNIGLLTGTGNLMVSDKGKFTIKSLQPPVPNSFEYKLSQVGTNYFYVPTDRLNCSLSKMRRLAFYYTEEQYESTISPQGRMDGAIYIQKSEAPEVHPDVLNKHFSTPMVRFCKEEGVRTERYNAMKTKKAQ